MWLKSFSKYLTVFKLSWERALLYRFDFLMWRIRSFILLLTLYFLWTNVFVGEATLFGFTREQILAYVLGSTFLSSLVFVHSMDNIANDIADGRLSIYLVKPISFLGYWSVLRTATRLMNVAMTAVELGVFLVFFKLPLFVQFSPKVLTSTFTALLLAIGLFTLLDFLAGLTAFWTLRAYGPRFSFKMLMEFTSGRFFPLNILPAFLFRVLNFLPFSFLVFFPLNVYLGRLSASEIYRGFLIQIIWIAVFSVLLKIVWTKGLRRYEAVGG